MSIVLLRARHATGFHELKVSWRVPGEWREGGKPEGHEAFPKFRGLLCSRDNALGHMSRCVHEVVIPTVDNTLL